MSAAPASVRLLAAPEVASQADALTLTAGAVDVWVVELTAEQPAVQRCRSVLNESEQARAARFRDAEDANRFIVAHAALRSILARYTSCVDRELRFEIGAKGKPHLAHALRPTPLHFNLSHSGDLAVVAVADREVGVDVERHRADIDVDAIANRYFYGAEARAIAAATPAAKAAVFLQHWVAKEAVLKGVGLGIDAGLDSFQVCFRAGEPLVAVTTYRPEIIDPDWYVRPLDAIPNYHLAVATRGTNWRTRSHFSPCDLT